MAQGKIVVETIELENAAMKMAKQPRHTNLQKVKMLKLK